MMRIGRRSLVSTISSSVRHWGVAVSYSQTSSSLTRDICAFSALFHDSSAATFNSCSHSIRQVTQQLGLPFCFTEFWNGTVYGGFPRASPFFNFHRGLIVEANLEEPGGADTDSPAINEVCRILNTKPWGSETVMALENLDFSFDVHIVRKVVKTTPVEAAFQFFHWLKSKGFEHDFSTYHAMINALGAAGCLDKMKELAEEMRKAGHTMRAMLFRDLVYWHACAGDTTGAILCWEEMKQEQIRPSSSIYATVIAIHAKEKRYEEAVKLYLEMVEGGLSPSSKTLGTFIDHLLDAGKLDAAYMIISKMRLLKVTPLMLTYAHLMAACAKVGNMAVVKQLGKDMRNICDRPGKMFGMAIQSLCREGMIKEAEVFAEVVWPELSAEERQEKIRSFGQATGGKKESFIGEDSAEDKLCSLAAKSNINGGYVPAVDERRRDVCFAQMEQILKTWDLSTIPVLEKLNLNWSNDVVYKILKGIKKPHVAWNFFSWLKCRPGFKHDVYNQITMLRILSQNQKFSSLVILLSEMQKERIKLSISTFNFIIKDCGLAKNAKVAFQVFNCIKEFNLEPNAETFMALIHAYARDKCHEEALTLFDMMLQAGSVPDAQTCTILICSLGLAGKADKAQSIFQKLLDSGCNLDVVTYTALIKAHCRAGNIALASQIFKDMKQAGIEPQTDTLRAMAWVCLQAGNLAEFQNFIKQSAHTRSDNQKALNQRKEALMLIYEVLIKNLVEEKKIDSPVFHLQKVSCF